MFIPKDIEVPIPGTRECYFTGKGVGLWGCDEIEIRACYSHRWPCRRETEEKAT